MSAFSLGAIRAVMGLDSSDYTKGILNAQVANEVFGRSVVNFVNNPLLGTVQLMKSAAIGTADLLKETASLNQEIYRTAERTGISAKTVSAMRKEFEDLHLSAEAVEKALLMMNRQIAAAAQASGETEFSKIGVDLRDGNGAIRDSESIFRDLTDAISQYKSEAERAAAVQKFFGDESLRAMQVLASGTTGLDRVIATWHKLGGTLEDEAARSANVAADALGKLTAAWQGFQYTAATEFLAGLVGETDKAGESIVDLAGRINDKLRPAAHSAGEAVRGMIDSARGLGESDTIEGLRAFVELFERLQKAAGSFTDFLFDHPALGWVTSPALMLTRNLLVDDATEAPGVMESRVRARQQQLEGQALQRRYMQETFDIERALLAARMAL